MKETFTPHPMTIGNGPKCWIDFSDAGTYTESPATRISEIRDKSGQGNTFSQTVEAEKPYIATVGGLTVADFQGGEFLKTAGHRPDLNLVYYDMYFVLRDLTAVGYVMSSYDIAEDNGVSLDIDVPPLVCTFRYRIAGLASGDAALNTPDPVVLHQRLYLDGAIHRSKIYYGRTLNDTYDATGKYAPNTDAPTYIGALEGVSDFLTGKIGEFLMFDPLEEWQGDQVSQYLMNKWGIS